MVQLYLWKDSAGGFHIKMFDASNKEKIVLRLASEKCGTADSTFFAVA